VGLEAIKSHCRGEVALQRFSTLGVRPAALMHVGIDARMIGHSGIGVYVTELIRHLPAADSELKLTLFGNLERLRIFADSRCRPVEFRAPIYGWAERRGWPREAAECDILHAPHCAAPGRPPRPLVVTVHDLIHLLGPGALRGVRGWWARRLIGAATHAARRVICDSEATRQDLIDAVPEAQAKREATTVIPLAPPTAFCEPAHPEEEDAWRHSQGLPHRHWLAVGIDKPHKGYDFLLGLIRETADTGIPLIVLGPDAGSFGRNHGRALRGIERSVRVMGRIEPAHLPWMYRGAVALLFPSRREGFGLPAVEAMAAGCPVLAARAGSLPEVVGDGGVLLPPDDPGPWLEAMRRLAGDDSWRRQLIEHGRSSVQRYSWTRTARLTLEVYRGALDDSRPATPCSF
jgi:glycosyltransferase involved in cell wall biosynthesis